MFTLAQQHQPTDSPSAGSFCDRSVLLLLNLWKQISALFISGWFLFCIKIARGVGPVINIVRRLGLLAKKRDFSLHLLSSSFTSARATDFFPCPTTTAQHRMECSQHETCKQRDLHGRKVNKKKRWRKRKFLFIFLLSRARVSSLFLLESTKSRCKLKHKKAQRNEMRKALFLRL